MEQYISKSAIVAEIEKRIKNCAKQREDMLDVQCYTLADDASARIGELSCIQDFIDTLEVKDVQEEPVSEIILEGANFNKSWYAHPELAFKDGAKWQKEHLWKPADDDDLPECEREVVVFTQDFPNDAGIMRIAIAHRPDPKGWDGKSIATGKIEHYTPKTYGKGGWNIPDVIMWLDLDIPKLEED